MKNISVPVLALGILLVPAWTAAAQSRLTNEEIVELLRAEVSEEIILSMMARDGGCDCASSAAEIIALKGAGASDPLIQTVLRPAPVPAVPAQIQDRPELLRVPLIRDLVFPRSRWVDGAGEEMEVEVMFSDIAIVVRERMGLEVFTVIPFAAVESAAYEQSRHPRVWESIVFTPFMLFSPSKKHWLTIQHRNDAGETVYSVFRLHKNEYRQVIAAVASRTGRTVVRYAE